MDRQVKAKMQDYDHLVHPINEEREQAELSMDLLEQNLKILNDLRMQSENEKMMIEEDLISSDKSKMELIYQREEIE